ncbi:cytochrome P450 [Streptomyces sp. NBC_00669]|uniref:hypothetical protein n=1 Tax=unclassified Streptomyces TaxID=2593676 RepID=UPI002E3177B9|nr:hypothetical protein [Streptomyces sp. NBC_00669]
MSARPGRGPFGGARDLPVRCAARGRTARPRAPPVHLGCGHGVHHCPGAPPSRAEAAIAPRVLFEQHPRLALDVDPAAVAWRTGALLRGLASLPVLLG